MTKLFSSRGGTMRPEFREQKAQTRKNIPEGDTAERKKISLAPISVTISESFGAGKIGRIYDWDLKKEGCKRETATRSQCRRFHSLRDRKGKRGRGPGLFNAKPCLSAPN